MRGVLGLGLALRADLLDLAGGVLGRELDARLGLELLRDVLVLDQVAARARRLVAADLERPLGGHVLAQLERLLVARRGLDRVVQGLERLLDAAALGQRLAQPLPRARGRPRPARPRACSRRWRPRAGRPRPPSRPATSACPCGRGSWPGRGRPRPCASRGPCPPPTPTPVNMPPKRPLPFVSVSFLAAVKKPSTASASLASNWKAST